MTITVEATYENGVLKPVWPLPLMEHEKVQVIVQAVREHARDASDDAERIVRRAYGLLGWMGDVETLRRLAQDPEFDPQESA